MKSKNIKNNKCNGIQRKTERKTNQGKRKTLRPLVVVRFRTCCGPRMVRRES